MSLAKEAFTKLYPDKMFNYSATINYSAKFKGYNANVQLNKIQGEIKFNLSKKWQEISTQIQTGLLQSLMTKIFKEQKRTTEIELYELFLKSLSNTTPRTKSHPQLEESFNRVNEKYLIGLMNMPNFELRKSTQLLGTYEYSVDTVTITSWLLEYPELLDYVMYHELLHKKHKFSSRGSRHCSHTRQFREEERKFENWELLEKQLNSLVRTQRRKGLFRMF
ncbi:M48 family metallopeptidase [Candidatus Woesearchaeota archaeon]|nr:M48 family metallopeptidase [Candidatus Woesearchaeota archaeon]